MREPVDRPVQEWLRRSFGDDSLILRTDPAWGAGARDGRTALHRAVAALAGPDAAPDRGAHAPRVSVAHAPGLGGFACSRRAGVGFDLEVESRVTASIASRIARDETEPPSNGDSEGRSAPTPAALWTAKEAAFKSLLGTGAQPSTASKIAISAWRSADYPGAHHCEAALVQTAGRVLRWRGAAWSQGGFAFSFFALTLN